jgi:RNA polymerase sigma-70 factor, ECF subfamily
MPFECPGGLAREEEALEHDANLNAFLREVEARAFRIAIIAVRDRDEALDIVQDAMLRLATRYAQRPGAEWRPLFYRILTNRIRDWHRRRAVSGRILGFFSGQEGEAPDPIVSASGPSSDNPIEAVARDESMEALSRALGELPERQRQAFMLRNFEDLDVAETAIAMGCSDGSVKTHHSRAVARLREILGEHWS